MNLIEVFNRVRSGETVSFRPHGGSMRGRIESGQLVTAEPIVENTPEVGDIVLCKVRGNVYLHLVKAIRGDEYLIGNNIGRTNGWTRQVVGLVAEVSA